MATKKRATPQDDSKRRRNSQVKIRLSEDEVTELKISAASAGMSVADFIMAGARDRIVVVLPGAVELRREMIDEGRNLNQALYVAYTEWKKGRPADLKSIQAATKKIEANLDRLAELILKWDIDLTEIAESDQEEVEDDADN